MTVFQSVAEIFRQQGKIKGALPRFHLKLLVDRPQRAMVQVLIKSWIDPLDLTQYNGAKRFSQNSGQHSCLRTANHTAAGRQADIKIADQPGDEIAVPDRRGKKNMPWAFIAQSQQQFIIIVIDGVLQQSDIKTGSKLGKFVADIKKGEARMDVTCVQAG